MIALDEQKSFSYGTKKSDCTLDLYVGVGVVEGSSEQSEPVTIPIPKNQTQQTSKDKWTFRSSGCCTATAAGLWPCHFPGGLFCAFAATFGAVLEVALQNRLTLES